MTRPMHGLPCHECTEPDAGVAGRILPNQARVAHELTFQLTSRDRFIRRNHLERPLKTLAARFLEDASKDTQFFSRTHARTVYRLIDDLRYQLFLPNNRIHDKTKFV